MTHHPYKGIFPILYTYFNEDGSIDRAAMQRQVDVCINAGAHGIAILGIVGEFDKLNVNEKREITEIVAEAVDHRVPLAVTVFGEPWKIIAGYDNVKNREQKTWHHLPGNARGNHA